MTRVVVVFALLASAPALAQSAEELWDQALRAELDADPQSARRYYAELCAVAPGTRLALRAQQRIDWIDARIDGPLEEVMRARSDPANRAVLDRLERALEASESSESSESAESATRIVREGWTLLAVSWERLGETRRAATAYRRWMQLSPEDERRRAAAGLAHLLERSGDRSGADQIIAREDLSESAAEISRSRVRTGARIASACILVLHVVLLFAMARRFERAWRRVVNLRSAAVLLVLLVPALLARAYDVASWDSFVWLLVTSIPLLAMALLAGATVPTPTRRRALAASAFVAQLALGVLVYTR